MTTAAATTATTGAARAAGEGPLVSIVLPTRNGARYLRESVDSVLGQRYANWELILVDDASSDDTPRIIAEYAARDPRVRPIRHDANVRLPAALNSGFDAARGEYFSWTSDDNLYRPEAIGEMAAFLEARRDVGMVYCDYTFIDEAGRAVRPCVVDLPDSLAYHNMVGACFLYRRAVAEKVGRYAENTFCAEDLDYWIRVCQASPIAPLHKDLYMYRHHPNSLSSTKRDRQRDAWAGVLDRHLPAMTWSRRVSRARGYLFIAATRRDQGDRPAARRARLQAFRLAPLYTASRAVGSVLRRVRS